MIASSFRHAGAPSLALHLTKPKTTPIFDFVLVRPWDEGQTEEENSRETEKEKARRRTLNSSMVQEALYDFTNDPEVVYNMDALKQKAIKRRKELEAYEEDNFIRKSLTKRERAAMSEITTAGTMGSEILGFNSLDALYDGYEPKGPQAKKRKTGKSPKGKGKGKKGGKKRKH
ncbi:uncharacterized protein LOC134767482 [Penaeus indicus]|uniref:uncharacterized protein LOC134767482 n=1 Tax=Penaeus indicus TaxID=29960 RepID=UPI00300C2FE7